MWARGCNHSMNIKLRRKRANHMSINKDDVIKADTPPRSYLNVNHNSWAHIKCRMPEARNQQSTDWDYMVVLHKITFFLSHFPSPTPLFILCHLNGIRMGMQLDFFMLFCKIWYLHVGNNTVQTESNWTGSQGFARSSFMWCTVHHALCWVRISFI